MLDNSEHELDFLFEPEEPKDPKSSYEIKLYDLIWSKIWLRLSQEQANHNQAQPPWSIFRLLEEEWNLKAPHPPAFQSLAQLPTATKFEPQGFIQSQHQNIVAKLLVGSVTWWFAPCSSGRSTKRLDFPQPSDTLIKSLVKYDAYFSKQSSIVSALEGLYSRFEESEFKVFDLDFMQGQSDHSRRREYEKRKQIEIETQEREAQAREVRKLEIEKLEKEKEEEIARRKRQKELCEKGKRAIAHWRVGDVEKFIATAKSENSEELFEDWLQDAEQQKTKVAGIKTDNMTYRVFKIMSILNEAALSVEVNS